MCRKEVKIPDELPPDHNDNDDGTYIVIEDGNDDQTNIPIEIGGGIEEIDNPEQADEWEPYDHLLNDSDRESDHSVQISTNVPHENDYESDHSVDISTTNWEGLINSIVGDEDQNHAVGQTQPSVESTQAEGEWESYEHLLNVPANESNNISPIPTGDVLSSAEMNGIFYAGAPPLSTLPPDRLQLLEAATVGSSVTVRDNAGSAHTVNVRQL
ncbi:hypothetical protein niasHT_002793 [Heterodera trifolii]|uniref:Uncharacterized protein n=1 Tax=Heterodera trifolii TaxID=157864 RepID=A0ABD2M892_9BILA